MNSRAHPGIFSSRYQALRRLKDKTLAFFEEEIDTRKDPVLVDFGCGDKPYEHLIKKHVAQYIGVDLRMNPKAERFIDLDSKMDLPDASADIVLSNQVLEHVDNPEGYLAEAWRVLKPGGWMILSTHGYWYYHPTPNDYYRWTSAGLKRTIEQAGFTTARFSGILGLAASGLQLFQDGLINKAPRILHPLISFLLQGLIGFTDKLYSQAQRDRDAAIYVVFAKKGG